MSTLSKLIWLPLAGFISLLCLASCSKSSNSNIAPTQPDTQVARVESPFGVMVQSIPDETRIKVAKSLAVKDVRAEITVQNFANNEPYLDLLVSNQFRLNLNFDYYGSSLPSAYVTDMSALSSGIANVLQRYTPTIATIENEELDEGHTGTAQEYINELQTATTVLHSKNIKVTNGGFTEAILCILTYRDLLSRGLNSQATDFASRCIPKSIIADLPALANNPKLADRAALANTFLQAYKSMDFDYINFHWYEPVLERWNEAKEKAQDTTHVNTQALAAVIDFLNRATGKAVISTEAGELYDSPGIVQDVMQQFKTSNVPFVIWYSGDGKHASDNAVALNNSDGSLRPNGSAFLQFLQANYK